MKAVVGPFLVVAAAAVGAAGVVPIAWDEAGRFQATSPVAPGKFVEVCGKLAQGEAVQWSFESPAPLEFNIHYHEGAKVVFPDKRAAATTASGTLRATSAQDYCWMWTHRGSAATTLTLSLQRARR